jgi:hypothetical protein
MDLNPWRSLNREWKTAVESTNSRIRTMTITYSVLFELLNYDKTIYDENWYKRKMIGSRLKFDRVAYEAVLLPVISTDELDLGDMILPQFLVEMRSMPDEYYILISILNDFPSPSIDLIELDSLMAIIKRQKSFLESIVLGMQNETELDNLITFVPICKLIKDDRVRYICYVNVIDTLLEEDFPMDQERFYLTDSLEELFVLESNIRASVETRFIPRNIASELSSFTKILIRNQF